MALLGMFVDIIKCICTYNNHIQGESEKTEFFDFQKQPEGIQKK